MNGCSGSRRCSGENGLSGIHVFRNIYDWYNMIHNIYVCTVSMHDTKYFLPGIQDTQYLHLVYSSQTIFVPGIHHTNYSCLVFSVTIKSGIHGMQQLSLVSTIHNF